MILRANRIAWTSVQKMIPVAVRIMVRSSGVFITRTDPINGTDGGGGV